MRKSLEYFVLLLAVVLCLLPSCGRGRVIGASAMSDIYAEMFLADQWINDHSGFRTKADTTRFYESIFSKHGYSLKDYDASVNYYLRNPEKYSRILEKAEKKLRTTQKALEEFRKSVEKQNAILAGLGLVHLPVFSVDSITRDTVLLWALVRDTLRIRDSIRRDSILRDSIRLDSLRLDSLRRDSLRLDSLHRSRSRSALISRSSEVLLKKK
jgi:hypothetical protein